MNQYQNKNTMIELNRYLVPDVPLLERKFPRQCEFLVPLRMSFRDHCNDGGVVPVSDESPEAYITLNGERIGSEDEDGNWRTVKCNYGIAWIMQVRHLPVLKQHYPSEPVELWRSPAGGTGQAHPGCRRRSLISMLMQNLPRNVSDAVQSSGFSDFTKCSVCCAVPSYCDCPRPKPPTTTATVAHPALKLNEFATKAMLNDGKG